MQRTPRILVLDSGVGGLSILREIRLRLSCAELVYVCDNAFFPYGTKPQAEIEARVEHVALQAAARTSPDALVIACNTASTAVLPFLRARLEQPVIGVVPAIKPAAAITRSGVIGLLATPGTVARDYTHALVRDFAPDCEVIMLGSSELVWLAEQKLRGAHLPLEQVRDIVAPLLEHPRGDELDTLVLGCTHFPLLREELAAALPERVVMVDSGEAIARRVKSLLQAPPSLAPPAAQPSLFTRLDDSVMALSAALADSGCGMPQLLQTSA